MNNSYQIQRSVSGKVETRELLDAIRNQMSSLGTRVLDEAVGNDVITLTLDGGNRPFLYRRRAIALTTTISIWRDFDGKHQITLDITKSPNLHFWALVWLTPCLGGGSIPFLIEYYFFDPSKAFEEKIDNAIRSISYST